MKTVRSVFGKVLVSFMLVIGLTAASCQQRSEEVRVKEDREGNEEVRIRERQNNDSVDIKRDQTLRQDEDGDIKVNERTKVETDRDQTQSQGSSNRPSNQGNDQGADRR